MHRGQTFLSHRDLLSPVALVAVLGIASWATGQSSFTVDAWSEVGAWENGFDDNPFAGLVAIKFDGDEVPKYDGAALGLRSASVETPGSGFAQAYTRNQAGNGFLVSQSGVRTTSHWLFGASTYAGMGITDAQISLKDGEVVTTILGSRETWSDGNGVVLATRTDGPSIYNWVNYFGDTTVGVEAMNNWTSIWSPASSYDLEGDLVGLDRSFHNEERSYEIVSYLFVGIGSPGPTGYGHFQGGKPDVPVPATNVIDYRSRYRYPNSGGARGDLRKARPTGTRYATTPAINGFGLGSATYIGGGSAAAAGIATLSAASLTSRGPEVIAYEFFEEQALFAQLELASLDTLDRTIEIIADEQSFQLAVGETLDFVDRLGSAVDSFLVTGIDDAVYEQDALPFVFGLTYANGPVANTTITTWTAVAVPEPATAAMLTLAFAAAVARSSRRRVAEAF